MPKRRSLAGKPLLLASGVGLSLACGGASYDSAPVVGNLMPPPDSGRFARSQLCVDVLPATAVVTIDGVEAPSRCGHAELGSTVVIEVSAPGHRSFREERTMTEGLELRVVLEAE